MRGCWQASSRGSCAVGFDDTAFAGISTPPITTLHVPKYDLGANAMRILFDRIAGRRTSADVVLRPTLLVRGSTVVGATHASPPVPSAKRVRR